MDTRMIHQYANGRYRVRVQVDWVIHYLGMYETLEEAIEARDRFLGTYTEEVRNDKIKEYSKEWFKEARRKQANKFDRLYIQQQSEVINSRHQPVIIQLPHSMTSDSYLAY
jgi:hypothetical protein